jgi:acetyl-CoA decarbonylase/synthase complex subunit gamma
MIGNINNVTTMVYKGREIPRVPTTLDFEDRMGSWQARWGIGRMNFIVDPGLYAVGNPTSNSHVFVTANYRMSFDRLRNALGPCDAWILVLDTKGINVWCAAGKGTFGTDELVRRIQAVRLDEIVDHRKLILPQLGATGVSAHDVKKKSGFTVKYGPVKADDLPEFLDAGMVATPEMRQVRFPLIDRLVLVPVELVMWGKYLLFIAIGFFVLGGLSKAGYSGELALSIGFKSISIFFTAYLAGAVLGPVLLPYLPGRAFAVKGFWIGLLVILGFGAYGWNNPGVFESNIVLIAWLLAIPAVTSFIVMNFTGASTYTSLSGVKYEMKYAVPIQITGIAAGTGLWIVGRFV